MPIKQLQQIPIGLALVHIVIATCVAVGDVASVLV